MQMPAPSLQTYALIKSLYDEGLDFIDCYWPFTLMALPREGFFLGINEIRSRLESEYTLRMPLHTIRTVLDRAKEKKLVEKKRNLASYRLTDNGKAYLYSFETQKEVDERINQLCSNISAFLMARGITSDCATIYDQLLYFLSKHIDSVLSLFDTQSAQTVQTIHDTTQATHAHLLDYIVSLDKSKNVYFTTVQDIVFGLVLSRLFEANKFSFEWTKLEKFPTCALYLDTNYVFSLFELHHDEFAAPAVELFELLKKDNFLFRVFPFTVDEICGVLQQYLISGKMYPTTIDIASVYSVLKKKGWTKSKVRQFITRIDTELENLGIEVDLEYQINLKAYTPVSEEYRIEIAKYKPLQALPNQNHDLAAIDTIKSLRGKPIHNLKDARAFFLSSDRALCRFDLEFYGHKDSGTVGEIMYDSLLTNLLWIRDPSSSPSVKSLIGVHSRSLLINRKVWERFFTVLRELHQSRRIEDDMVAALFHENYLQIALSDLEDHQVEGIGPEFVLSEIEKASEVRTKEHQLSLLEQKTEYQAKIRAQQLELAEMLSSVREEQAEKEIQDAQRWLDHFERLRKNIMSQCTNSARNWSLGIATISTLLLTAFLSWIYLGLSAIDPHISALFTFIVGSGGMYGTWFRMRRTINTTLRRRCYTKSVSRLGLEEELSDR
jgi:hypothetical protein